jgi:hypothetical protein
MLLLLLGRHIWVLHIRHKLLLRRVTHLLLMLRVWCAALTVALRWQYRRSLLVWHLVLCGRSYGRVSSCGTVRSTIVLDMPGGVPLMLLVLRVVGHVGRIGHMMFVETRRVVSVA